MNGKTANLSPGIFAEDSENTGDSNTLASSTDDTIREITGTAVNDWFIIKTIPVDSLKDDYILIPWNISPSILVDGFYSLQAEARCFGTILSGKSNIVTGTIDRTAPKLLGAQSPTDGILHPDDEISISFNEKINPAKLSVGNGDIKLFNTVTSEAIDFTHTASAEKIVIEPQIQNHFIENQTLRAEVKNIEDVYGNLSTETFTWEFFVNRNPVEWTGGGIIMEEYKFMPNMQYGTPTSPVMITASSQVLSKIDLPSGWKWFSLNLTEADMSVNHILQSLAPSDGDLLKSQTTFDQYVSNFGWVGTLPALNTKSAYMLRLAKTDTLELIGFPTDVEKDTIGIVSGWNWIGYTPQNSIEVNTALASLKAAATGDILKSQFKYAQFVENLGWIGSQQYMTPKQGYLINAMHPGKLLYPFYPNAGDNSLAKSAKETLASTPVDWMINPSEFQFNMTVTCIVNLNGIEADSVGDVLAAFSGGLDAPEEKLECRGWAQPIFIPQLNRYLFFLMVYSNQVNGENIQFRFYDSNDAAKYYVPQVIVFKADDNYGSVEIPYEFTARELGIGDPGYIPEAFSITDNYPNPFNPITRIGYGIAEDCHVQIQVYNVLGELVKTLVSGHQTAGYRYAIWDGTSETGLPVASGVYLIRIKAGDPAKGKQHGIQSIRKMTLMK